MSTDNAPLTRKTDTIAARIRGTVARLGFTEFHAAEYFGVPLNTYRKWANGEREPGAAVGRLVEVLGMIEAIAPDLHRSFLPTSIAPPAKRRGRPPSPAL